MTEFFLLIHAQEEYNIGVLTVNIEEKDKVLESRDFEKNLKGALEDYFLGYTIIIHEIKQTEVVFIELKAIVTIGDCWKTIISLNETKIY